jgi:hypothetical protein
MSSKNRSKSLKTDKRNHKIFVRTTAEERLQLEKMANEYGTGNISRWMRERALKPMLDVSIRMQDKEDES